MHRIFVYGTLKQGYHNHRLLTHAVYEGAACTTFAYRMWDCGFPLIKPCGTPTLSTSPLAGQVRGEVYIVDQKILSALDELESEGKMYVRERTPLVGDDGQEIAEAMVYEWIGQPSGNAVVPVKGVLNWTPSEVRRPSVVGLGVRA